jgi:predicted Zn finger-like uncharacterized protein
MILTCPQCATRYQTDVAQFGAAGRKVRCAKCGHVWHQTPELPAEPEPAFTPIEDVQPAPPGPAQHAAFAPPDAPSPPLPAAAASVAVEHASRASAGIAHRVRNGAQWAVLAAFVFTIGWSAVRFRKEIAILWPQTATFYKAIGKPVNTTGLTVKNLTYRNETDDGRQVLAIAGRVVNLTTHKLAVPPIRVTLTDNDRRVLYDRSFSASVATLAAGGSVAFMTRLASPPSSTSGLQVQVAGTGK